MPCCLVGFLALSGVAHTGRIFPPRSQPDRDVLGGQHRRQLQSSRKCHCHNASLSLHSRNLFATSSDRYPLNNIQQRVSNAGFIEAISKAVKETSSTYYESQENEHSSRLRYISRFRRYCRLRACGAQMKGLDTLACTCTEHLTVAKAVKDQFLFE